MAHGPLRLPALVALLQPFVSDHTDFEGHGISPISMGIQIEDGVAPAVRLATLGVRLHTWSGRIAV